MPGARQIKLGVSMIGLGYHPAAWRHPDTPPGGNMDLRHYVNVTKIAERGLFDMVFLADGVGIRAYDEPRGSLSHMCNNVHFEPLTLLSALAMVTEHVGLVATASTTYNEPYHVARKFASLDHISGGRAGWNVVTSRTDMEAQNFNLGASPPYDQRYDRAIEFVDVVRGLWDSWDDDAFVRDQASGLNYRPEKLRHPGSQGAAFFGAWAAERRAGAAGASGDRAGRSLGAGAGAGRGDGGRDLCGVADDRGGAGRITRRSRTACRGWGGIRAS